MSNFDDKFLSVDKYKWYVKPLYFSNWRDLSCMKNGFVWKIGNMHMNE